MRSKAGTGREEQEQNNADAVCERGGGGKKGRKNKTCKGEV